VNENAPPEIEIGADVDVEAIMEEIRETVRRRRESGDYPPDVLVELELAETAGSGAGHSEAFASILSELRRTSGFSAEITTASQKPLVAPVVSKAKGAIRTSLRWYLTGILQQVNSFAGNVVRAVASLSSQISEVREAGETTAASLDALRDELRNQLARLEQRTDTLEQMRAHDRLSRLDRALKEMRERLEAGVAPGPTSVPTERPGARSWRAEAAMDYLDFENRFRGSLEDVANKQRAYVDLFRDAPGRVVDLGFGRGEFLGLLRDAGVEAYGVDRHPDMVAYAREAGLEVQQGDSLEHLASLDPASLGGIFCAQMVEHLDPPEVVRFFELAADAMAPGGTLVVETINPESLFVFAHAFYVDLGHLRPLHPLTLDFLARSAGFSKVRTEYLAPIPPEFRPQPIEPPEDGEFVQLVERLNENFRRIDEIVFGPQDFAIVAVR